LANKRLVDFCLGERYYFVFNSMANKRMTTTHPIKAAHSVNRKYFSSLFMVDLLLLENVH
jgi:hypothetical protein